jgi:sugar PTS system EIIA component
MNLDVLAPLPGRALPLADVPDPVFAQAMVGPGCAIDPPRGAVEAVAPVAGKIVKLHPHAYVVVGEDGRGVLVHLGLDTVQLKGEGFRLLAEEGADVEAGTPVVAWDTAAVEAGGRQDVQPGQPVEHGGQRLGGERLLRPDGTAAQQVERPPVLHAEVRPEPEVLEHHVVRVVDGVQVRRRGHDQVDRASLQAAGVAAGRDARDRVRVAVPLQLGQAVERPGQHPPERRRDRRRVLAQRPRHVGLLRLVVGVAHPAQHGAEHHEQEPPLRVRAAEAHDLVVQRLEPGPLPGPEPVVEADHAGQRHPEHGGGRPPAVEQLGGELLHPDGRDGGDLGPGQQPGERVHVHPDRCPAPDDTLDQRRARAHERVERDRARPAQLAERPGGHLGDELGREPVQAVGAGGGVVGQAQGEQLAVADARQRREGVDLLEAQLGDVDGSGHASVTTLSRMCRSRPRRVARCWGATVRWRTGTTRARSNPAASPSRAISASAGMITPA